MLRDFDFSFRGARGAAFHMQANGAATFTAVQQIPGHSDLFDESLRMWCNACVKEEIKMCGRAGPQGSMFNYFLAGSRVQSDHPLHSINANVDEDRLSIRPTRLHKDSLRIAPYSVRSDQVFCELLEYYPQTSGVVLEHGL